MSAHDSTAVPNRRLALSFEERFAGSFDFAPRSPTLPSPACISWIRPRLIHDRPKDSRHRLPIKRPIIQILHPRDHLLLALGRAQRESLFFLQPRDFHRKLRAQIQKLQKNGIDFIDFLPPVA